MVVKCVLLLPEKGMGKKYFLREKFFSFTVDPFSKGHWCSQFIHSVVSISVSGQQRP